MGWKGAVRSFGAAMRAAERDAKRRQRELEKEHKQYEKMEQLVQAAHEVELYENHIAVIQSLHKDCSDAVDWLSISTSSPPKEPKKTSHREDAAVESANSYDPGFIDKLFRRIERKRELLKAAIQEARTADTKEYEDEKNKWKADFVDWEESVKLSKLLFDGDKESKINVIKELNPFSEISSLGSQLSFQVHDNSIVEAEIHVHGTSIVPSEVKSLLQSGKLSVKSMPKSRFYEIYQDYVCSCSLRVANELHSILPEHMVIVTAIDEMLNTKSGHLEKLPILSIAVPRKTLLALNMDKIDPSNAMSNFLHNMSFKKTQGFEPVERISPESLNNR